MQNRTVVWYNVRRQEGAPWKEPKKKTEKPSLAAQCRVLTEAAVLWALLAAGAQLFFPEEQSALPEGAALGWAALRICLVTPLAEELAFRGGALYLLQPLGGRAAVVVQALLFAGLHGSWTARPMRWAWPYLRWTARKARSVWPGCALHMINNCLVFAARLAERGMG